MSTHPHLGRLAALLALGLPLAAQETTLKEVVVSASGFQQEKKQAPASITVISRKEIEASRANSLGDLLRDVEGLDVHSETSKTGGMTLSLRGMPASYTLVLIDGRRQNSAGDVTPNGFGDSATAFLPPPAAIERIEIIRGPMSTLYGSDAMGGVVHIITRRVSKVWSGQLGLDTTLQEDRDYGDTRSASLFAQGPLIQDRLGLQLKGRTVHRAASTLSWPGKPTTPGALLTMGMNPVQSDVNTAGLRLSMTAGPRHDLTLDLDTHRSRYDNAKGEMGTLDTPTVKSGYLPELRFNRTQAALAHRWRLANGLVESSLSRNATETVGRTIPAGTPGKVAGSPRTLESVNTILDSKVITQLGTHQATVGLQYWEADMTDAVAARPYAQTQWGLFMEDEWHLAERLALTLGLRHDRHDTFGGHTTPRAYLVYHASPAWTLKGGVSKAYKTPRLDQLFEGVSGYGRQGRLPIYGNPDLKPETSVSTELGAILTRSRWSGSLTVFRTDFRDAIGSIDYLAPGATVMGIRPVNFSQAEIRGAELTAQLRPYEALRLSVNYTRNWSEQQGGSYYGGVPFTLTPRHAANLKATWVLGAATETWLQGEYRSSRYRSPDTAGTNTKARLGDFSPYTLLHLGGSWRVTRGIQLQATIYNLLDKDFLDMQPVTVSNQPGFANRHFINQEPRRLWVSASWTF